MFARLNAFVMRGVRAAVRILNGGASHTKGSSMELRRAPLPLAPALAALLTFPLDLCQFCDTRFRFGNACRCSHAPLPPLCPHTSAGLINIRALIQIAYPCHLISRSGDVVYAHSSLATVPAEVWLVPVANSCQYVQLCRPKGTLAAVHLSVSVSHHVSFTHCQ